MSDASKKLTSPSKRRGKAKVSAKKSTPSSSDWERHYEVVSVKLFESSFEYRPVDEEEKENSKLIIECKVSFIYKFEETVAASYDCGAFMKNSNSENIVSIKSSQLVLFKKLKNNDKNDKILKYATIDIGKYAVWSRFISYFNFINSQLTVDLPPMPDILQNIKFSPVVENDKSIRDSSR